MYAAKFAVSLREGTFQVAGFAAPFCTGRRWLPSAILAGTLPFLLSWGLGIGGHQTVSAILLALLCLSCARADSWAKGIAIIALAFFAHSLLVIGLSYADPERAAALLPGADWYWNKQYTWITTGWDPEYQLAAWVPAHLQLLGVMILYTFTSLGAITFYVGFYQVDLMNFYNAQLMNSSANELQALVIGWHSWSLLRGVGYAIISYEMVSLALQVITGRTLSPWRDRRWRWTIGLGFLLADGILKAFAVESTRARLFSLLN